MLEVLAQSPLAVTSLLKFFKNILALTFVVFLKVYFKVSFSKLFRFHVTASSHRDRLSRFPPPFLLRSGFPRNRRSKKK